MLLAEKCVGAFRDGYIDHIAPISQLNENFVLSADRPSWQLPRPLVLE